MARPRTEQEKLDLLKTLKGTVKEKWDIILDISAKEDVYSQDQVDQIKKLVVDSPMIDNVLVVGCGDGTELKEFQAKDIKATGISVNKSQNEISRKQGLNVLDMDMHELDFKNDSFDMVYCKDCYKQAISPLLAFCEFYRVSKKHILISEPDMRWAWKAHNFQLFTPDQFEILAKKFDMEFKHWTYQYPYVIQHNYLFTK